MSRVEGIRPGVAHTRGLVLTEGILVLLDRLEAKEPHTYDFVYHNFGALAPGDGWTAAAPAPLGATALYDHLLDVQQLTGAGPVALCWDLSAQLPAREIEEKQRAHQPLPPVKLYFRQLPIAGGAVYTALTGMNNPNTFIVPDASPTVITRAHGTTVNFLTVLEPATGPSQVKSIAQDGNGIAVTLTNGKRMAFSLEGS